MTSLPLAGRSLLSGGRAVGGGPELSLKRLKEPVNWLGMTKPAQSAGLRLAKGWGFEIRKRV